MKTVYITILIGCLFAACNQYEDSCLVEDDHYLNNTDENLVGDNSFVSIEEATETANSFMNSLSRKLGTTRSVQNTSFKINSLKDGERPAMYVFNYSSGGFVIVGASRNYYPVLAYSDEDSFDLSANIPGVEEWLKKTKASVISSDNYNDSIKNRMHYLWKKIDSTNNIPLEKPRRIMTRSGNPSEAEIACYLRCEELMNQAISLGGYEGWYFAPLSYAQQSFADAGFSDIYQNLCYSAEFNHSPLNASVVGWTIATIREQVGPLLSTKWGQGNPYNNLCDGHNAGCGSIALAQVLKYYQYPNSFSLNGYTFDWSNIPNYPDANSDQAALVRLVYNYIGTSNMFGAIYTTPGGMEDGISDLGYSVSTGDEDYQRVEQEIMSGHRPVIMLGNDDNLSMLPNPLSYIGNSHYWVCDGGGRRIENKLLFFTEWQPYGSGTFVSGWGSLESPNDYGGVTYLCLHMNWGWNGSCNGWFAFDETNSGNAYSYDNTSLNNSGNGDFEHSRMNFYISRPH